MFSLVTLLLALLTVTSVYSDCPNGWKEYLGTELCIKGFDQQMAFMDAMEYCISQGNGGSLVSIHNAFENMHVVTTGDQAKPDCDIWIGLYNFDDSNKYSWTDGSAMDYQNWAPGYPMSDVEDSMVYLDLREKNKWVSTHSFTEARCFVCQQKSIQNPQTAAPSTSASTKMTTTTRKMSTTTRSPNHTCEDGWTYYNGFCYYQVNGSYCYTTAVEECVQRNSSLASILSSAEQVFVNNFTLKSWMWIGLVWNISWGWQWTDGSPLSYTNWGSGWPASDTIYAYGATVEGIWTNRVDCDGNGILCKKIGHQIL